LGQGARPDAERRGWAAPARAGRLLPPWRLGRTHAIADPDAKPGPDLDWEAFLGDASKVPFSVQRFFSWRKYLDYAGGPCTDLFPHVFTPFVSALGLNYPSLAVASGGIFKYTTYDREVPDTFNMCVDYPEKVSAVLVCTLANDYVTEPAIRGDEGTLTLQNAGGWEGGFDSITLIPANGKAEVIPGMRTEATRCTGRIFSIAFAPGKSRSVMSSSPSKSRPGSTCRCWLS